MSYFCYQSLKSFLKLPSPRADNVKYSVAVKKTPTKREYGMELAKLTALQSKDPNTQVGACFMNEDNRVVGLGYNGFPRGLDDLPWNRDDEDPLNNKYLFVCHAELNAVTNSTGNLKNSTLYVTLFPCNECMKLLIQYQVKKVVYLENKYSSTDSVKASLLMAEMANIVLERY